MSRRRIKDGHRVERFSVGLLESEIAEMETLCLDPNLGNGNLSAFIRKIFEQWKSQHKIAEEKAIRSLREARWHNDVELLDGIVEAIVGNAQEMLTEKTRANLIRRVLLAALGRLKTKKRVQKVQELSPEALLQLALKKLKKEEEIEKKKEKEFSQAS